MTGPRPLHRLFGLSWSDFFQGSDVTVELEMDLSRRQQLLDVVLIRRGTKPVPRPLPDGFEDFAPHNLITFKSHQESLDGWTLAELIGHSVNYRKQAGPSPQEALSESEVRLYAVCVRHPQNLDNARILQPVREGVYEIVYPAVANIRVIVVHGLPQAEQNAMLHLFSARTESLRYARDHFRIRSTETSTLLLELFQAYREDINMATQLEEFARQTIDKLLSELPPEELCKRLSPQQRVEGLSPEQRLKGMSAEDVLSAMSPEEKRAALAALRRELGQSDTPLEQN
ncbi:MAG: hypothetical protein IT428_19750 [Planctomycetaceae bacterium]|nr:hypothetical protein [Planctomycetaceae bacterium]